MDFIDEAIIVLPEHQIKEVESLVKFPSQLVAEESLPNFLTIKSKDHAYKNFHLKADSIMLDCVKEEFILSDDDYRPIQPIKQDFYIKNNKYKNYIFYDLEYWNFKRSSYDISLINTLNYLKANGYDTLAYSAHMPQILNKSIFREVISIVKSFAEQKSVCDWSMYFNIARKIRKEKFHNPSPHTTLCWPDYPFIWPRYVKPKRYFFENYYPHLYNDGDLFEGITSMPNMDNYKMILELKLNRIKQLIESGKLPMMSYRHSSFSLLHPLINIFYPLYFKHIRKESIDQKELDLQKIWSERKSLNL